MIILSLILVLGLTGLIGYLFCVDDDSYSNTPLPEPDFSTTLPGLEFSLNAINKRIDLLKEDITKKDCVLTECSTVILNNIQTIEGLRLKLEDKLSKSVNPRLKVKSKSLKGKKK